MTLIIKLVLLKAILYKITAKCIKLHFQYGFVKVSIYIQVYF